MAALDYLGVGQADFFGYSNRGAVAILPGTGPAMLTQRADPFLPIVPPFLDSPLPGAE